MLCALILEELEQARAARAMAAMDTDEHHSQTTPQTNLRRSNSAPLINGANISEASLSFLPVLTPRHRRSSTSQMANGLPVPVGSPHSRLLQIRKEEFMDETEQDRMVNTSLSLSTSCDELSLMMNQTRRSLYNSTLNCDDRRHSIDDPTNYFPSSTVSSPSPTRCVATSSLPRPIAPYTRIANRNKYMRALYCRIPEQIPRARSLTPSPIPSPTRQISRRSLSPILLRQSTFNHKRKFFSDGLDDGVSPSKKAFSDNSMQHSSSDDACDSTQLPFAADDDSGIETTTPTTPVTSMLFCETSHLRLPYCRPKYTPPRSPLARSLSSNSNEETKRFSLDGPPCFTFAPVKD